METTKFINMEMALIAATTAFMAAVKTGKYCSLSGSAEVGEFTIDVHLDTDELFTLPSGYLYSEVEEETVEPEPKEYPPFKMKMYTFDF